MNLWVIAFPSLMFLGSLGTYLSSPRTPVTPKVNVGDVAMGTLAIRATEEWKKISPWSTVVFTSISLSLNILLTFMIVLRLVLHGRNVRTATGSVGGISGLYKSIATMLIESSALLAVSSLLVIGTWGSNSTTANAFTPILAESQVRAILQRDDWAGCLMYRFNGQVIASLLIIQRVANKSSLTSETVAPGSVGPFKARSRWGLSGGSSALPSVCPMSSMGECEINSSGELVFGVKPAINSHPADRV